MAEKKAKTSVKYKATSRFFEWIPKDSPDIIDYVEALEKGESVNLKNFTPNRIEWCLANDLIVKV